MKYHDSTPDCHNFQHPIPQPHQPSISACLIVKDGATTLDRCLASIAPVVDEIIVVDTGSTDSSVEIARRYTDKIFSYPWHDDFAAARNESLRHATGDWVMVIDADEWLKPDMHSVILAYLQQWQPKLGNQANHLPILNARVRFPQGPAMYKRFLFPNQLGVQFRGRVHEIPVSDSQTLQYFTCHDLNVEHEHIAKNRHQTKQAYYQALLEQSLRESQQNPELFGHLLKHLGDSYLAQGMWWQAKRAYTRFLNKFASNNLPLMDPFVQQAIQRLRQLKHQGVRHWRKGLIATGIGLLAACQVPVAPTVSITPPNSYIPVEEFAADFRIMYIGFCYGSEAIMADSCYNGGGSAIAGEQFTNDEGEVCVKYAGCVGGSLDGHGNNNGGSGGGSGCTTYDGSPCTFCPPGQALNEEGFCAVPESCDKPITPEQLQPLMGSGSLNLPPDQALQDYGKTNRQLNSAASGMQIQSFVGDFTILKKNPDKQQQRYEQLLQQQQEQRQALNLHLEQLDSQITTLENTYSDLGVPWVIPEGIPDNLDDFETQVEQHFENIKTFSKDLSTSAILDTGTEYVNMLHLYRQLLRDVLSDSPALLPVDADTAPRSSIQALKRLGKQLEKAWDKIQEQHQKTDLQVNTLLQALNISASDFTETYHDNIEQSLQNSIHEAETILSNLEAQLVAETEGFSVQANNGKPQQRQKLQEQIQKVKDSLQTLKELTVDGSSYAIETAKSVEKQLRNQMQQLQNIAQKYGPDALQQVQQFYAKMDSVFGWMPQWQFSAQVRSSFLSLCFKNQIPLDYYKNVPMSLRGDEGYVNVDKFTQQGKKGALVDPKTKYSLSKDRAINSGSGPHGESYWKLYDSKGSRVGTLAKDGKYIRK